MTDEQEFEKKLTTAEIDAEISKIGDFFRQIPDGLKAHAAEKFIYEIVNRGSRDYYQALGIFQEAMNEYREVSYQIMAEQVEEEELQRAFENAQDYRCLQEMDWVDNPIAEGEVCRIGCVGEDERYAGGRKYIIFREDRSWIDLCQHCLDSHFELLE